MRWHGSAGRARLQRYLAVLQGGLEKAHVWVKRARVPRDHDGLHPRHLQGHEVVEVVRLEQRRLVARVAQGHGDVCKGLRADGATA